MGLNVLDGFIATCTAQMAALIGLSILGWVIGLVIAIIFDVSLNKKMNLAVKIFAPILFTLCGSLLFFGLNVEKRVDNCFSAGQELIEPLLEDVLVSMVGTSDLNQMIPEMSQADFDSLFDSSMQELAGTMGSGPEAEILARSIEPLKTSLSAIFIRDEPISLGTAITDFYTQFQKAFMKRVVFVKFISFIVAGSIFVLFLIIAILTAVLKAKKEEKVKEATV